MGQAVGRSRRRIRFRETERNIETGCGTGLVGRCLRSKRKSFGPLNGFGCP